MRLVFGKIKGLLLGTVTVCILASCGGGTNNDQGVAFSFNNFKPDCADEDTILTGLRVPLDPTGETEPDATDGGGFGSGAVGISAEFENNLTEQFIRLQRVFMTFHIPGAAIQPPDTSNPETAFLQETGGEAGGDDGGEDTTSGTSTACVNVDIVPAQIRSWLVLNKHSLPELPFTMEVTMYGTGISKAGDRFDSNSGSFSVLFTPDIPVAPTEGEADAGSDDGALVEGDGDTSTSDGSDVGIDQPAGDLDTGVSDGDTGSEGADL